MNKNKEINCILKRTIVKGHFRFNLFVSAVCNGEVFMMCETKAEAKKFPLQEAQEIIKLNKRFMIIKLK